MDGLRHAQNPHLVLLPTNNTKKVSVNASDQQDIEDTNIVKKIIVNATIQQDIVVTSDFETPKIFKKLPLGP